MSQHDLNSLRQLDLAALEAVDVRTVSRDTLVDINDVVIDDKKPKQERIASFLEQIKNPYCYKCGSMVVKVGYSEESTLEDQLKTIFTTMI